MPPVRIDVIAPLPEGWGVCVTCEAFLAQANLDRAPHERSLESFPPDWQEEYIRLSDLIMTIAHKYQDRILIRLYDPRSLQGLAKSIRHGIRRYPTFLVEGREKITGLELAPLERAIQVIQNQGESS
jgi:hypothetical protein